MKIVNKRKMYFGGSWYPSDKDRVLQQFRDWDDYHGSSGDALACVVPHAGWYFSGKLAYATIKKLSRDAEVVVVAGGHLPNGSGIGIPSEESWETPLGLIDINTDLIDEAKKEFIFFDDTRPDNTVEIQLPIVKYFFPECSILPVRMPPDRTSIDFAEFLFNLEKNIIIIGSTDLSHYGPNYSYSPFGSGKKAEDKIRNEIDSGFINHIIGMEAEKALSWAEKTRSACSAGAAVSASAYALKMNKSGHLVDYYTSSDIIRNQSFVGYAGIYFS